MRKCIFAILTCFIVVSACATKSDEEKYQDVEKALMTGVSDLTHIPSRVQMANEPYIHGKIAVFQALEKKAAYESGVYLMQPLYYREMQENYATKPDEVGTVALVNCMTAKKGVYKSDDGKEYPAMVEDCDLTMIDRSKEAVILKKQFETTPSDERRAIGNSVSKQSSQSEIAAFLKGLPKR